MIEKLSIRSLGFYVRGVEGGAACPQDVSERLDFGPEDRGRSADVCVAGTRDFEIQAVVLAGQS